MEKVTFKYRFGTAEFDESRFELRVAGLPVDVERRALEVLIYLLRHAGEVVTKDELLREVWAGRITVDKVLPNAINKLRRALGETNASHISTQARIGYRLDGVVSRIAVGRQPSSPLALSAGQLVPSRPSFMLRRQLGSGNAEVWLAEHQKTGEQRVYKFAVDADRLRSLKREVTLLRVLQEGLDDTDHVADLLDWNFEQPPYFLEYRYAGPTLAEWAAEHLATLDVPARIALFLQIADAVAAAHSVGVLHKDLKPANVLVTGDATHPHVRLTDFGSGRLMEPDRLAQLGITRMGLTLEEGVGSDSTSGTPIYLAPELFVGHAPTVKADVFALGVLLYQILCGRIGQPMASGWEKDVDDERLREDLRLATDGQPERRLATAAELADRLRNLEPRRTEATRQQRAQEDVRRDREALARAQARKPIAYALFGVLAVGIAISLWLQQQAVTARNQARAQLDRANVLARFLNEDLIGRSNPLVQAKGPEVTLRELLLTARDRVPARFASQPATAAALHGSLASLFNAVDLFSEAEAQARQALDLLEREGVSNDETAFQARTVLVRVLSRLGRFDAAAQQLKALEQQSTHTQDPLAQAHLAAARSTLHVARGEFDQAVAQLRAAIDGLSPSDPASTALRDSLRLDLIASLIQAGQDKPALDEGSRLIADAQARQEDSSLLVALARLAQVRALGEDHAAAKKLLLEAQPVIVARLGENHSRHLQLLGELLGVAFRQGDWPQAILYAQMVHERVRAKLGDAHVMTYVSLVNWARTLDEAGQAKDAVGKARTAYEHLRQLVGPGSPQTQDAAFVLAQIELELGDARRAQPLIDQLDAAVLESGRATGQWPATIDLLRGMALRLRGETAAARPMLDAALAALKEEEDLAHPSRLYVVAQEARTRMR